MDLMAVCDSELRTALSGCRDVKYACAVLTEPGNGAVMSMVNLMAVPAKDECFEEMNNIAVGNTYEPGGVLTQFPSEVLEKGLEKMSFDFCWMPPAVVRASEDDGSICVLCTPLYVSRIFGGIANDGVMFDPYLVTPSASNILCSPAVAAFSDRTMLDAPQSDIPEKAARGIMDRMLEK